MVANRASPMYSGARFTVTADSSFSCGIHTSVSEGYFLLSFEKKSKKRQGNQILGLYIQTG